ncbi:B3 domain-containing transcription factor VRN1-like [Euphorbia lathyris]|uniref:B3 domain-containing transcription factor VRN1-like n=1 Tax=Euphorbia lathyris TaxID=212925 RepID=UPI00331357AC
MASCSKNNNLFKEDQRPHFFKFILADSVHEHKEIPRKFVKRFGGYLSSPIILKASSGQKWKVDIAKSEGAFWLQNGWKEFAEFYSLDHGYLVVFEYDMSAAEFNVIILDNTATEIEYPFTLGANFDEQQFQERKIEVVESESDVPAEILPSNANLDEQFEKPQDFATTFNTKDQTEVIQRENKTSSTNKKLIKEEKKKAVEKALSNFQPENPSFTIIIQPSYVDSFLVIPSRFAKKYINKEVANIILNSVDQRTWSVDYVEIKIGGLKVARLCRGWRKFVEDNHLKVGDVCIFELINHNATTTFKVVISRENQDAKTVCQC